MILHPIPAFGVPVAKIFVPAPSINSRCFPIFVTRLVESWNWFAGTPYAGPAVYPNKIRRPGIRSGSSRRWSGSPAPPHPPLSELAFRPCGEKWIIVRIYLISGSSSCLVLFANDVQPRMINCCQGRVQVSRDAFRHPLIVHIAGRRRFNPPEEEAEVAPVSIRTTRAPMVS